MRVTTPIMSPRQVDSRYWPRWDGMDASGCSCISPSYCTQCIVTRRRCHSVSQPPPRIHPTFEKQVQQLICSSINPQGIAGIYDEKRTAIVIAVDQPHLEMGPRHVEAVGREKGGGRGLGRIFFFLPTMCPRSTRIGISCSACMPRWG